MSIQERLKIAYENVAYSADKTWKTEYFHTQKSHMDLFLRETELQHPTSLELRPRTVRDSIPESKLAKYSDYEYNYSRELSYNNGNYYNNYPFSLELNSEEEPWMAKEVDHLFELYCSGEDCPNNVNRIGNTTTFESPFLSTHSLSEYFLKLQITNSQVKKLWNVQIFDPDSSFLSEYHSKNHDMKNDHHHHHIRIENFNLFSKQFEKGKIRTIIDNNSSQNKRLYSAVLQGYSETKTPSSPEKNKMTILNRNFTKNGMELGRAISDLGAENCPSTSKPEGGSTNQNFKYPKTPKHCNMTYFKTVSKNICSVYPPSYKFSNLSRHMSTKFAPPPSIANPSHRMRQSFTPSSSQYPSIYMLVRNSLQNNLLQPIYNPMVFHRNTQVNNERSIPQKIHLSEKKTFSPAQKNNILGKLSSKTESSPFSVKTRKKVKNLPEKTVDKPSGLISIVKVRTNLSSCSSCNSTSKRDQTNDSLYDEVEKVMLRSIDMLLKDSQSEIIVPIAESSSERLERQALEQYQSSCENFFLDLERQAAEEYEELETHKASENVNNPPNIKVFFGGFFIQYNYYYIPIVKCFKKTCFLKTHL